MSESADDRRKCPHSATGLHLPRPVLMTENGGASLPEPPTGMALVAFRCDECRRRGYGFVPESAVTWFD